MPTTIRRVLRNPVAGYAVLGVFSAFLAARLSPALSVLELDAFDRRLCSRPQRKADPRIVLIELGSFPQREKYRMRGCSCDTPRTLLAKAIGRLTQLGAKTIVLDLYFARPCPQEDPVLAAAIKKGAEVVVAATARSQPGAVELSPPTKAVFDNVATCGSPTLYQPYGKVRMVSIVQRDSRTGRPFLPLGLEAVRSYCDLPAHQPLLLSPNRATLGKLEIATSDSETLYCLGSLTPPARGFKSARAVYINWCGPAGSFRIVNIGDLLAQGRRPHLPKMRNCLAIVGHASGEKLWTSVGAMSGLEIHANVVQTFLDGEPLTRLPEPATCAIMVVLATLASMAARLLRFVPMTLAIGGVWAILWLVSTVLLAKYGVWSLTTIPMAAVLGSAALTTVFHKTQLKAKLARLVPSVFPFGEEVAPGGKTTDLTVLFSDIRRFSTLSEHLEPDRLMKAVNAYLSRAESIFARHKGTMIKSYGDGIVAVFAGGPRDSSHAANAVRAAYDLLQTVTELQKEWPEEGRALFDLGIAINTGKAALGFVGSEKRLEPSVLGDSVNVASRMEGLTKELNCRVIASKATRDLAADEFEMEYLGPAKLKGRETPIELYKVVGKTDDLAKP